MMKIDECVEMLKVKRECFDYEGLSCESKYTCDKCCEAMDMAIEILSNALNMGIDINGQERKDNEID